MKTILKKIEIVLRHAFVYPLMRLFLRNQALDKPIELKSVRKILFLRNDRIGDMIVSTPVFRKLKELHPELTICVFAGTGNAEIVRHNKFVDELYIGYQGIWKLFMELRRCKTAGCDVVVNFIFNRTTSQGLIANFVAPKAIKIGQGSPKYKMYFNRLLTLDRTRDHMVEILTKMIDEIFGSKLQEEIRSPEIFIPDAAHAKVDKFLSQNNLLRVNATKTSGSYAVINFSAKDKMRCLSKEQVKSIVIAVNGWGRDFPVITHPPGESEKLEQILSSFDSDKVKAFPSSGSASLLEIASLVKGAHYVVTCDTAIVHFASAMKTPVFVLFNPQATTPHEWMPYGVPFKCLYAKNGSAADSIPCDQIIKDLSEFESGLMSPL